MLAEKIQNRPNLELVHSIYNVVVPNYEKVVLVLEKTAASHFF